MAHLNTNNMSSDVWFVDSGYSNYMTCSKSIFKELDETEKRKVELGSGKEVQVEGKGAIHIKSTLGKVKLLYNVQFVPNLGYNFLSVGQLLGSGYSVLFDDDACVIKEKNSGYVLVTISMTQNRIFPLEVSHIESFAFATGKKEESSLWHLGYGHLNIKGLKLLSDKGMVLELPTIGSIDLCEGCIYGKQTRKSFPVGKA